MEIDSDAVREAGKELGNLGVYQVHFMFDQNCLHEKGAEKEQNKNTTHKEIKNLS